jgi:NAD(P) transhydrogenase subunit alpha
MIVGVPRETFPGESRVALIPAAVAPLKKQGLEVWIEAGAGEAAGFADRAYEQSGAKVVGDRREIFGKADIILQVRGLGANTDAGRSDLDLIRPGQILIATQEPLTEVEAMADLAKRGAAVFALELLPRITRAQSMDVLSSQANLAGYKAVLLAAEALNKIFPMLMTAAGTLAPAKVFVIGAGVAGLQALATAHRLGAVVSGYDVRPEVKEQVESLGAKFVELPLEAGSGAGGYAKAMGEEFYAKQRELMTRVLRESEVVITTAAVPGKKAPTLITAEMTDQMTPGSVIVDLAAERGGNCELTHPGETVEHGGVMILGPLNLASTLPHHASQMYAKNISAFLLNLVKKGELQINLDDEIIRDTLVARDGEVKHPLIRERLGLSVAAEGGASS